MRIKNILLGIGSSILPPLIIAVAFIVIPKLKPEEEMKQTEEPEEIEETAIAGQILTGNAVLYSDMDKTRVRAGLEKGTLVDIIAEGEEWWQVEYEKMRGYVESDYIVKVEGFDQELLERPVIVLDAGPQEGLSRQQQVLEPGLNEAEDTAKDSDAEKRRLEEERLCIEVMQRLEDELEERGYTVIQAYKLQGESFSNRERSELANEIQADILIALCVNRGEGIEVNSAQTICPTENNSYITSWLYRQSYKLSEYVRDAYAVETGCAKEDIWGRDDLPGISWCRVPVTILKLGNVAGPPEENGAEGNADGTNAVEGNAVIGMDIQSIVDREKMVMGIANGVDYYFGRKSMPVIEDDKDGNEITNTGESQSGEGKTDTGRSDLFPANEAEGQQEGQETDSSGQAGAADGTSEQDAGAEVTSE